LISNYSLAIHLASGKGSLLCISFSSYIVSLQLSVRGMFRNAISAPERTFSRKTLSKKILFQAAGALLIALFSSLFLSFFFYMQKLDIFRSLDNLSVYKNPFTNKKFG
jgi:hypothetical protein